MIESEYIHKQIEEINRLLVEVPRSEYYYLKRKLNQLKKHKKSKSKDWNELRSEIDRAAKLLHEKQSRLPEIKFNEQLPVSQRIEDILEAINQHQVVIICGETGSGKTTQLPKICLKAGRGIQGYIGHTQPRRLATRTVAKRISDELNSELGQHVGYKIRHLDKSSKSSYIKLMTDGILLAELQQDRYLNQYDTLIIDEAHERSLNIDFILGYLRQLLPKRPDLKIIITSATIDVERFSNHFDNAPIIEVSGRSWPVDVLYMPVDEVDEDLERLDYLLNAINELTSLDMGDILIFLEGEGEIHETDRFLVKQQLTDTDILPLYARLSSSRQNKIFAPHKRRHIVLATNVAETSLTIPGIRYVIDAGMARISRYSHRSKVQRLPIEKVSRAAAEQRKGRCGRTSDGVCIRLYSEQDFESRPEFSPPEILRTNLASVILQMKALKIGDIESFPFIDPPEKKLINDGLNLLREINALDNNNKLTTLGKRISRFPVDPRYARILIAANEYNCLTEILIIISALSIQDPKERPIDSAEKADKAHAQFDNEDSDFIWYLNLWRFYQKQNKKLSQSKLRKLCQQNFLSYIRMREWQDIHRQLRHICTEFKFTLNTIDASYQNIHCAILTGMPSHFAYLSNNNEYTGARNIKLNLFPGSGQFSKKPKWVVASELVETSRLYARNVARIDSQWLLNTAEHLLKYQYSDPKWDDRVYRVIANESVSLYGLPLVSGRKINFGQINPAEAKAIFIRQALIEGEFETSASFYKHNNKLIQEIRELEVKSRRPDVLNEQGIYDFYHEKLPSEVNDQKTFSSWIKKLDKQKKEELFLNKNQIMHHEAESIVENNYPEEIVSQGIHFPLEYKFKPGEKDDGINIDIPIGLLNQFDERQLEYLVPGMLEEKITALLKTLPKSIRKSLVPLPETARKCAQNMTNYTESLTKNLSAYLYKSSLIEINEEDWETTRLPNYLSVTYRILNEKQELLKTGKDIGLLRDEFSGQSQTAFNQYVENIFDDEEVQNWDFDELPVSQELEISNKTITLFPSLIVEENRIYKHAFDNQNTAEQHLLIGLRELYKKELSKEIKYLGKSLPDIKKLELMYSSIGDGEGLIDAVIDLTIDETFLYEYEPIRTKHKFNSMLELGRTNLLSNANSICILLKKILRSYHDVRKLLSEVTDSYNPQIINDINEQLDYMVYDCFIIDVEIKYLNQYPRYFESILKRLDKLSYSAEKDLKNVLLIKEHWGRIRKLVDNAFETDGFTKELNDYRWMIEELRVSLFTQELKTIKPVSIKRMDKLWDAVKQSG